MRPELKAINGAACRNGEHHVVPIDPARELERLATGAGDIFVADGSIASVEGGVGLNSDDLAGGGVADIQPRRELLVDRKIASPHGGSGAGDIRGDKVLQGNLL